MTPDIPEIPLDELGKTLKRLSGLPQIYVPFLGASGSMYVSTSSFFPHFSTQNVRKDLRDLADGFEADKSFGKMRILQRWCNQQPWMGALPRPFQHLGFSVYKLFIPMTVARKSRLQLKSVRGLLAILAGAHCRVNLIAETHNALPVRLRFMKMRMVAERDW